MIFFGLNPQTRKKNVTKKWGKNSDFQVHLLTGYYTLVARSDIYTQLSFKLIFLLGLAYMTIGFGTELYQKVIEEHKSTYTAN